MLCKAPRDRDPFGFTSGMDAENGLWKLGARYYDSGKSAFIQQDRYLGDPSDPLSVNRYVYCGLDPVNFVDPTGFKRLESQGLGVGSTVYGNGFYIRVTNSVERGFVYRITRVTTVIAISNDPVRRKFARDLNDKKALEENLSGLPGNIALSIAGTAEELGGITTVIGLVEPLLDLCSGGTNRLTG